MKKLYVIRLTSEERHRLQALVHTGRAAAYKRRNAQLLLWVDQGEAGSALPDREAAERSGVTVRTVENVRRRGVLEGLERVLQRRPRSRERARVLDGQAEAQLVAIACSDPPEGCARSNLGSGPCGASRRSTTPLFVCAMEQVLPVDTRAHDPLYPVICMDETTKQCVKETRPPQPPAPECPARYDAEYERNGVAHLLLYYAPLENWRRVDVKSDHVATTWAEGVRRLVEEDFPEAERITLVMDNLNTHAGASLYKAFPAPKARRLLTKLQFVYTPRHGSWLNMAGMRVQRAGPSVPEPTLGRQGHRQRGSDRLGKTPQRSRNTRPMAIHHRGCAHQIAQPVSKTITLMDY